MPEGIHAHIKLIGVDKDDDRTLARAVSVLAGQACRRPPGMTVGQSGLHAHVIAQWSRAMKEAIATGEARLVVGRFAPHITARVEMVMLPLNSSADGIPKILGGMFVIGTFPPGTEIEALELVPVLD
jgi:hypothetical protein